MKTFEKEHAEICERDHSSSLWDYLDWHVPEEYRSGILAAHQAEMDRVVEEVIGDNSLHMMIEINGDRCEGFKTEREEDCNCPAGEENTLRMNQRARYKAIKER